MIFGICICSIVQQEFNCILAVFTSKKEESINHNIFIKIIYLQLCYQLKFCNSYAYSVICSVRILLIKISCSFSLKKNPFAKSLQKKSRINLLKLLYFEYNICFEKQVFVWSFFKCSFFLDGHKLKKKLLKLRFKQCIPKTLEQETNFDVQSQCKNMSAEYI